MIGGEKSDIDVVEYLKPLYPVLMTNQQKTERTRWPDIGTKKEIYHSGKNKKC